MAKNFGLIPHLDLYNFTDSRAEESQYVLTSPRSLEACARHNIKPMELLPRTMEDFIEEKSVQGYNENVIEVMYKKFQKERLSKLRICREERERIIDEKESHKVLKKTLLGDDSYRSDSGSIENLSLEEDDAKWKIVTAQRTDYRSARKSDREKPSILSFLDATSASPRNQYATPRTYGESSDRQSRQQSTSLSFKLLSASDSDEDNVATIQKSFNQSNNPETLWIPYTTPNERKVSNDRATSSRKPRTGHPSARRRKSDLSVEDIADSLPNDLKNNLSLMSDKDRRIMEIMMLKANKEQVERDTTVSVELSQADFPNKHQQRFNESASIKDVDYLERMKQRDVKINRTLLRKDMMEREAQLQREANLNVKNSKWQQEYNKQTNKKKHNQLLKHAVEDEKKKRQEENLRQLSKEKQLWNDIAHEETKLRLREFQVKSQSQTNAEKSYHYERQAERQKREQHNAMIADIEDKHHFAQEHFQQRMKQKDMERNQRKMKERERAQQRHQRLKTMENDMELWQQELTQFQDTSAKRAAQVVGKKKTITSLKAHNKRLQKELDHAAVKAKLEEDERLRKEELLTVINLKNQRSKLIHQEKEEYSKASRQAARASRAVRDVIKEQAVKSSFDKMAAEAEKIARIERLGHSQKKQSPFASNKGHSTLMLG